jgi:hypothetical protein
LEQFETKSIAFDVKYQNYLYNNRAIPKLFFMLIRENNLQAVGYRVMSCV